jgi:sterol 3beta-glucosyltransferase
VQAVVHHGGSGTTAQAIRAGVPSLVLPAMADQYFWGARVAALRVGPTPIPQHTLTVRSLVDGLRAATQTAALRTNAQALGACIRAEDGVEQAVDFIASALQVHSRKTTSL